MNRLSRVAVLVTVALGTLISVSRGGDSIGAVAVIAGSGHDLVTVVVVMITLILVAVAASHRLWKGPSS